MREHGEGGQPAAAVVLMRLDRPAPTGGDDGALLRDAATVLTARRRLDALLVQLTTHPFNAAAYDGLRAYLAGPADRAAAAYVRVRAATAGR